jgi:hypothetical protein
MPQRDRYHDAVRKALIADGWTITHDPYYLRFEERRGFVDLGAEAPLAAERDSVRIAVEIKSFINPSVVADLAVALGQYTLYKSWLLRTDPTRSLYLAIDQETADDVFAGISAQVLIEDYGIRLIVVDMEAERIVEWRNPPPAGS